MDVSQNWYEYFKYHLVLLLFKKKKKKEKQTNSIKAIDYLWPGKFPMDTVQLYKAIK